MLKTINVEKKIWKKLMQEKLKYDDISLNKTIKRLLKEVDKMRYKNGFK